ncbi:hypothetical protein P43SY_007710 [Pythium insidiosum]|uniref:BTB domain-containing protein n=1 Tax=Pythium insidiosum TaxID=114742 RepID=A0AAD5MFA2_PYTIN|nr:hypothetical protein P43SY_007710 [Pythium insidiosum]
MEDVPPDADADGEEEMELSLPQQSDGVDAVESGDGDGDGDGDAVDLATDRLPYDALESLFTDRTEGDSDPQEHELEPRTDSGGCDALQSTIEQPQSDDRGESVASQGEKPSLLSGETPASESRAVTPVRSPRASRVSTPQELASSTKPIVPPRPPRPFSLPSPVASGEPAVPASKAPSLEVVSFDVGGQLFRCKASLLRRHPLKRLNRILSCGCDEIAPNTYFIDRNPQHFEIVLDWYRTGKFLRRASVNEQLLRDDAAYFDLLDELFPTATEEAFSSLAAPAAAAPVPAPAATTSTTLSYQSSQPVPPVPRRPSRTVHSTSDAPSDPNAPVRFSTREIARLRPLGPPLVLQVWRHQHLVVESVRGRGKLLVRVCDLSGLSRVVVDHAVLFDSRSCFYLHDGRARLQRCVLPGDHLYSLWMEPHSEPSPQGKALVVAPPRAPAKGKAGAARAGAAPAAATEVLPAEPVMEVELRVISTFTRSEEVTSRDDQELLKELCASGVGAWSVDQSGGGSDIAGAAAVRCLFLPPHLTSEPMKEAVTPHVPVESESASFADRDAIAEQLLGTKSKSAAAPAVAAKAASKASAGSAIKRSGAAIAGVHGGERVVVYQQDKLPTASTAAGSSRVGYATQQPRQLR